MSMSRSPRPAGVLAPLAAATGAFLLVYLLCGLPPGWGLHPRSDDFGYLLSVLGTLDRGALYTHDWLAPYSAVITAACAFGWSLTGNLPFTALAYMTLSSLAALVLLYRLLAARLAPRRAAVLVLALGLTPTFFSKAADFHGGISTFAFFLAALVFHEERKTGLFHLAAFLAFANRQNNVVLLVLPMLQAAAVVASGRAFPLRLAAWLSLFGAAALALHFNLNATYARTFAVFTGADLPARLQAAALALAAGVFVGLALLAVFGAPWRPLRSLLAENLGRPRRPACASALLAAAACFWPPDLVRPDFPLFGALGWGPLNAVLPWLLLPALWILDYRLLRPSPYLALAAAYLLIGSLRGVWWDYYFLEVAALCLLIATEGAGMPGPGAGGAGRGGVVREKAVGLVLGLAVAGGSAYAYLFKVYADKQALAVTVFERLERSGRVAVDEMTNAPFGYLGWKLFDHFTAHEGRDYGDLADFQGYVRRDRVSVETQLPWRRGFRTPLEPGAAILETGRARVGFAEVGYRVVDRRGPGYGRRLSGGRPMELDLARYVTRPFPLDRREWNALRDGGLRP